MGLNLKICMISNILSNKQELQRRKYEKKTHNLEISEVLEVEKIYILFPPSRY